MDPSQHKDYFRKLLEKYRSNTLEPLEYTDFLKLLESGGHEPVLDLISKEDWKSSAGMLDKMVRVNDRGKRKRAIFRWISAAAVVLTLIWVGVSRYYIQPSKQLLKYSTTYGETRSIDLPDGSRVLLNANSSLSWNKNWQKEEMRRVEISGEAFFEVRQLRDRMKFAVDANGVRVNVTGTSFNVRDRAGEVDIFLHSGAINLETEDSSRPEIAMNPGSYVVYNTETKEITKTENKTLSGTASWVEGMLEFENEYLPDILDRFEELYGIAFSIENAELANKRMDLSLPYSNWDLIKRALEISLNVEFTVEGDTIFVE